MLLKENSPDVTTTYAEAPMASKGRKPIGKQINFRAPPDIQAMLEDAAEGMRMDVSGLIRLIIVENIRSYKDRADEIRARNTEPRGGKK